MNNKNPKKGIGIQFEDQKSKAGKQLKSSCLSELLRLKEKSSYLILFVFFSSAGITGVYHQHLDLFLH